MAESASRWARLRRHAVFPLLVYLVLSQALRENYPFSHYPMYSQPSSRPLHFPFLADGSGNPLPVAWHTGMTPSQVGKLHGTRKKKHDDDEKAAAADVLAVLRTQNALRKGRELPVRIQLIDTAVGFEHGGFTESNRVLAENQAP
jgi:hypothetical protein